jgi:hypothetical protein
VALYLREVVSNRAPYFRRPRQWPVARADESSVSLAVEQV